MKDTVYRASWVTVDVCSGSLVRARVWARGRSKVILHSRREAMATHCLLVSDTVLLQPAGRGKGHIIVH